MKISLDHVTTWGYCWLWNGCRRRWPNDSIYGIGHVPLCLAPLGSRWGHTCPPSIQNALAKWSQGPGGEDSGVGELLGQHLGMAGRVRPRGTQPLQGHCSPGDGPLSISCSRGSARRALQTFIPVVDPFTHTTSHLTNLYVLVSWGCRNQSPRTGWLNATQMYSRTVLKAGSFLGAQGGCVPCLS